MHDECRVVKTSRRGAFGAGFVMFAVNGISQPLKKAKMFIHKHSPERYHYLLSLYMSIISRNAILFVKLMLGVENFCQTWKM